MDHKYRFAVQILYYDCEQFILKTIENCADFVEKIYILYSPLPYKKYNPDAVNDYPNPSKLDVLRSSKHFDKIEVISNTWYSEEDQRNEGLEKAIKDGFDFLIIQDADEFYNPEDYLVNLKEITLNPNYTYYRNPWIFYWKTPDYQIVNWYPLVFQNWYDDGPLRETTIAYNACFAINCRKDVAFKSRRMPDQSMKPLMLSGLCHHLSFVLNDAQLMRKLNTWSHTNQVRQIMRWYRVKWLGWTLDAKNIHPIDFVQFNKAERHNRRLPKEIIDFNPGLQQFKKPKIADVLLLGLWERYYKTRFMIIDVLFVIKKYLKAK